MPWREPSRPIPDSLMPPKGATSVEIIPVLTPTDAVLEGLAHPHHSLGIARVEVGGEAVLGVVGDADRLGLRS